MLGRQTKIEAGLAWYEFGRLTAHKLMTPLSITFGEITTHNHFVLDRGGKVFKQTAPVIKLKPDADEAEHVRLLGVLNSSTACFWLRQVCFPKGGDHQGSEGARVRTTLWDERFAFNASQIANLPIPAHQPTQLPTALVQTSTAMQAQTPAATLAAWSGPGSGDLRARLASARDAWAGQRRQLIAWQEELDWQIYGAFGLVSAGDGVSLPEGAVAIECPNGATSISPGLPSPRGYPGTLQKGEPTPTGLHQPGATEFNPVGVDVVGDDGPRVARSSQPWAERCSPVGAGEPPVAPETMEIPPLNLGERAFEIVLARKLAAGEVQTTWFARHGSTPLTALPRHWPAAYRERVERRIARIIGDPAIRLIEQPEYKRRWNTEPWDEAFARAAREWLLLRLETYFFGSERMTAKAKDEGKRMKDEGSDAAALLHPSSFNLHPSASRPALTTTNQLAAPRRPMPPSSPWPRRSRAAPASPSPSSSANSWNLPASPTSPRNATNPAACSSARIGNTSGTSSARRTASTPGSKS